MRCGPGKKRDPREMVNFQQSASPNSRMVHPNLQEIEQRGQQG